MLGIKHPVRDLVALSLLSWFSKRIMKRSSLRRLYATSGSRPYRGKRAKSR